VQRCRRLDSRLRLATTTAPTTSTALAACRAAWPPALLAAAACRCPVIELVLIIRAQVVVVFRVGCPPLALEGRRALAASLLLLL
jgi:hypothetical protein